MFILSIFLFFLLSQDNSANNLYGNTEQLDTFSLNDTKQNGDDKNTERKNTILQKASEYSQGCYLFLIAWTY
jgi:hypothetical protein